MKDRERMGMGLVLVALLVLGCGDREERPAGLVGRLAAGAVIDGAVDPGREACAPLLGEGWLRREKTNRGAPFRWTGARDAHLRLAVADPGPGRLVLHGYAYYGEAPDRRARVLINGRDLGEAIVPPALETTIWTVPAGVLRSGWNDVVLRVDRTVSPPGDSRRLGLLVDWLGFVPDGAVAGNNPYEEAPSTGLERGRRLTATLAAAAGDTLVLAWESTASALRVTVGSGLEEAGAFVVELPGPAGGARLPLPSDLPDPALLTVRGSGTRLVAAELVR